MQIKHKYKKEEGLESAIELRLSTCLSQYNAQKAILFQDRNYNP